MAVCAIWARASRRGFKKLVLYNTHGGNTSLVDVMARDLRAEFGLRTFRSWFGGARFEGVSAQERAYGFHAGEVETAYLLHATPELVDPDRLHLELHRRRREAGVAAAREWLRGKLCLAHARHRAQRRDGRSASGDRENGERWSNEPRAHCGDFASRCTTSSRGTERDDGPGRLRQRSSARARRALPHADGVSSSPITTIRRAGPWPTLLMRQPYGRDIASTVVYAHPVWFARHGYHVVIQDVRGRGDSEGEFYPFRHEARDGAETIAWLRTHPSRNGRIGMYGFSYQGATQLLAAAEQPEGLVCIAPHMTAAISITAGSIIQGALRLASSLAGDPDAEGRRAAQKAARGQRPARTAWANLRRKPACCRSRASGAHRRRLAAICARLVRSRVRHLFEGQRRRLLALCAQCGQRLCARESIPDRRAVAAHSVGRSRRRVGLWREALLDTDAIPAALVQSLAERFRRIRARRAFAILC
jgi:hypothetical protein